MHTLTPPLEVDTPLGWGHAILVESDHIDSYWTVIVNETLAIVTFRQSQLKVCRNYTMNWGMSDKEMRKIIEETK